MKLMVEVGEACAAYQSEKLRNLSCKRIQVDEIWSFVYSKSKNIPSNKQNRPAGSIWNGRRLIYAEASCAGCSTRDYETRKRILAI